MKHPILFTILLISASIVFSQIPERQKIASLEITEISTWMKNFKFQKMSDSVHYETRKYDRLGNETYYYKNLRHFGWNQVMEYNRLFSDSLLTKEITFVNEELKRIDTFGYNAQGDFIWQKSWSYPDPDTIITLNTYFYNNILLPDSVHTVRIGNFGMDTVRFFAYYAYDTSGNEVWVKTKDKSGMLLSEFRNTYNAKGAMSEASEEYFGKDYFFDKEYYDYYENGLMASKTDGNNNRYEYYYDYNGNVYYMLYVDKSGEPAAGYYYFHKYRAKDTEAGR